MTRADLSTPRGLRLGVGLFVALLHLAAILALIRAFAPEFTGRVANEVIAAFTVTVTSPPPPAPTPQPRAPDQAGAEGEAGRKAIPREAIAPKPRLVLSTQAAPPIAGKGSADSAGTRDAGAGTGAGAAGVGSGAGGLGNGQGGGGAAKAVKIAGDINSTRDYPKKTRELRLGDHVIVVLTVGIDGRVKACRVHRASRDAEADRITCQLAMSRFRFRAATDAAGNPVESDYGWQQRWFAPAGKDSDER